MEKVAPNGAKTEFFTPSDLIRNRYKLNRLVNFTLQASGLQSRGKFSAIATAAYFLDNYGSGRRFEVTILNNGVLVMKFRTTKERTRFFFQCKPTEENKKIIVGHINTLKSVFPNDFRFVTPGLMFQKEEVQSMIESSTHEVINPNKVWRVYLRPENLIPVTQLPEGYYRSLLTAEHGSEALRFYDDNYKRFKDSPGHSFDPKRLAEFPYCAIRGPDDKIAAAVGPVGEFFWKSLGRVIICGDLCTIKGLTYPTVPRVVASDFASDAFSKRRLIGENKLIVADMINQASLQLAVDLGAEVASEHGWYSIKRKKNGNY